MSREEAEAEYLRRVVSLKSIESDRGTTPTDVFTERFMENLAKQVVINDVMEEHKDEHIRTLLQKARNKAKDMVVLNEEGKETISC